MQGKSLEGGMPVLNYRLGAADTVAHWLQSLVQDWSQPLVLFVLFAVGSGGASTGVAVLVTVSTGVRPVAGSGRWPAQPASSSPRSSRARF
jgi:hypothetical protein